MAILHGTRIHGETRSISDILSKQVGEEGIIQGEIFDIQVKETWNGEYRYKLGIYDGQSSIFISFKSDEEIKYKDGDEVKKLHEGVVIKASGRTDKSKYTGWEIEFQVRSLEHVILPKKQEKTDDAEVKRVELQLHTTMSQLEGIETVSHMIKRAKKFGHRKVAITDTSAQAFPEAYNTAKKEGMDVIFGMSVELIDDDTPIVFHPNNEPIDEATYTFFDVETTGFSNRTDYVIEIGATKFKNFEPISSFQRFIKVPKPIPAHITTLTGISQEMIDDEGIELQQAMKEFHEFWQGSILVAHNATFDKGFIQTSYKRAGMDVPEFTLIDTLQLSRVINEMKSHTLDKLAKHYKIKQKSHHRADDDAEVTGFIFMQMIEQMKERNIKTVDEINSLMPDDFYHNLFPHRITLLAQNQTGLKNLFRVISHSHVQQLTSRGPVITKKELEQFREGILVGSGSHMGYLFDIALNKLPEDVLKEAAYYDYLEIQPAQIASHMARQTRAESVEAIEQAWKMIHLAGKKLGKPVVATGHVHYIEPEDSLYYHILLYNEKAGLDHMKRRGRLDDPQGLAYFRTTQEMLESFPYLTEEERYKVVVENTNKIADMCEMVSPIPLDENGNPKLFTPKISGADEDLKKMCYERAHELYGEVLPEIVEKRLEKELNSIIKHGFAVIYLISQKLVKQSNARGYLVGSRGSVGSSFVATMSGITTVNPLAPHYICPSCKTSEFIMDGSIGSGFDLPDKTCSCGTPYKKDGQDIPFETFLGFEGDKVPDIDLNFSGDDQANAHKDVELEFGSEYVLRAGTVGTVADKTAFGFVKNFAEGHELEWNKAEVSRIAKKITGVKRTTGQHPGGMLVIPDYMDVHDFTPSQYPANKKLNKDKEIQQRTSHFDFHSIHDNVLKLDILGHDAPTILRLLQDLTGIDPEDVPAADPKVMKLFYQPEEALGISLNQIEAETGTLGIPELGTDFVQKMIIETKPKTFEELVRISGLSHGTDVWTGNAQELIKNGTCTLMDVIDTRDNIMVYLQQKQLESKTAFTIMESVRKGKGLKPEWEPLMKEHGIPDWYISSCKKIKYMFPKAHAVAYVEQATKIAWFKVNYPVHYYAAVFSARYNDQDIMELMKSSHAVRERIAELKNEISNRKSKGMTVANEAGLLNALNLALEAKERGIVFGKVRLYDSSNHRYKIDGNTLIPPFSAIKGVGEKVAIKIYEEAQIAPFRGLDDFVQRTKANKTNLGVLRDLGCLEQVEAKQHTFF